MYTLGNIQHSSESLGNCFRLRGKGAEPGHGKATENEGTQTGPQSITAIIDILAQRGKWYLRGLYT